MLDCPVGSEPLTLSLVPTAFICSKQTQPREAPTTQETTGPVNCPVMLFGLFYWLSARQTDIPSLSLTDNKVSHLEKTYSLSWPGILIPVSNLSHQFKTTQIFQVGLCLLSTPDLGLIPAHWRWKPRRRPTSPEVQLPGPHKWKLQPHM